MKLKVTNYRRFAGTHSLMLDERLVALVGPNEAGKSSLLRAIESLSNISPPTEAERTRGISDAAQIAGLYLLNDDDRAMLADEVPEAAAVTHAWLTLTQGHDKRTWTIKPTPARDQAPRQAAAAALTKLSEAVDIGSLVLPADVGGWDLAAVERATEALGSADENLDEERLSQVDYLLTRMHQARPDEIADATGEDGEPDPEAAALVMQINELINALVGKLTTALSAERLSHPTIRAREALVDRVPTVAFFDADARNLEQSYELAVIADNPPPALSNLCVLAGLDLVQLRNAVTEGRHPAVTKAVEDANARLKSVFQDAYSQSPVYPRLSETDNGVIRIFFANEDNSAYTWPEERSDGLRWFFALHSFLAARGTTEPILLVDEAETHLHYDAQADLVDQLMQQRIATQVIYSTHSVGCLPPDLGSGIRAVLPVPDAERSQISNSFWSIESQDQERIGYGPLLFAMGAQLLSLTVPRYGVLVEGPSDAVLLPHLVREAADIDNLDYRFVPGLSEIAEADLDSLDRQAGRTVCLLDGDGGGSDLRALIETKFAAERVLDLSSIKADLTLEDLLSPLAFMTALNVELETWGWSHLAVALGEVPDVGRWKVVEARLTGDGKRKSALSKVRVAQRAVDLARNAEPGTDLARIIAAEHAAGLAAIHTRLNEIFER